MGPKRVIFRWLAMLAAAFVAVTACLPSAVAQRHPATAAAGAGTIADIRIVGIQRIEPETVRSYLLLQKGDHWDTERVDRSLKALFATGLFADVDVTLLPEATSARAVRALGSSSGPRTATMSCWCTSAATASSTRGVGYIYACRTPTRPICCPPR